MSEDIDIVEDQIIKAGKIRPTQLITTFGPGALINVENDSVIVKGIDFWAHRDQYLRRNHVFLQKITKKSHFKIPHVKKSKSICIAVKSFPMWGFCSYRKCNWLQRHKEFAETENFFRCNEHSWAPLLPARLVMVCPQGHISEFPWIEWAHGNPKDPREICEKPKLKWTGGTHSTSLFDYRVECECGARNNMSGATSPNGIRIYHPGGTEPEYIKCNGEMPWLDSCEECRVDETNEPEIAIGVLARSTSMYYSKIVRGLVIPKLAHEIIQYLQGEEYEEFNSWPMVASLSNKEKAQQILLKNKEWVDKGYTVKLIEEFMDLITIREGEESSIKTELDVKEIEYQDLVINQNYQTKDLHSELQMSDIELTTEDKKYFQLARKLEILTLIEVQQAFTRLTPPSDTNFENLANKKICRIEVDGKVKSGRKYSKNDWLPANRKQGEGIFMVFNDDFFKKLVNPKIQERLESMIRNKKEFEFNSNWPSDNHIDEKYIILHSIAHILIKKLAPESGFDLASIGERIYSSKTMNGILIYTTSSGDGSFGGLIKQISKYENFSDIIFEAIEEMKQCSRDPICISEDPNNMSARPLHLKLNGSACFACMLLPETSCEYFNKMLDRKIWTDDEFGIIGMMK